MAGSIHEKKEDHIGWIVFDHPERRNALSDNMWSELSEAARRFAADPDVRVVILRGAGEEAFISGADISQFANVEGSKTSRNLEKGGGNAFLDLERIEKPVIAMIHGYCIGGGVAVSLSADLRYAADDASFGIPAARLGVGYDLKGVDTLARLVGMSNAKEILYSAQRYDAADALRMGLVNRVLRKAELEPFVRDLAARISRNAPLTVHSVKVIARELEKTTAKRDTEKVASAIRDCFESGDFEEGVKAFLEKREPTFQGS
jgi:enoyl-CoA hydratase